ncbi:MAG: AMP-binding protein [Muribaculaceae bacterium]|nr:AMP-binding protein [Muribaculaceae bacterium]
MKQRNHLNEYIQDAIRDNWEELALTDFHGVSFQYRDVARKIAKLHLLFENIGLVAGDRVALCGRNSAQWAIASLACLTYGAVAVPILHDFKSDNIHHLVTHSDARLFFVDESTWENLDPDSMPAISGALQISDYSLLFSRDKRLTEARAHLNELFGHRWPDRFTADDVKYPVFSHDTLALINYTSGSTGFSKGVMLSYGNLWSNIQYSIDHLTFLKPGDGMVCMLPLAHMYGLVFEMLHTFVKGCHIYFLTRTPSPRVIMDAFATVHPKLIITVPLIIEKIVRTRVFPMLEKPMMKLLMHIPLVDDHILAKIKEKIDATFGGQLQQMIIGGAGLNADVAEFLRRIRFPFTVGYGMTECAPLITYAPWDEQRPGSCGRIVDRMEARIDSPDPATTPGVLYVRGQNVMQGYYKNPEATAQALSPDGWLNTGDICSMDADGFITIRGRDKSMILGPSGQNIYPEEIEQKLNSMLYVAESLVVDQDGKLVALVYPDFDTAHDAGLSDEDIEKQLQQNVDELNKNLPAYSHISRVRMMHEEFEKTPKRSIKRYLYQH